MNMEIVQDIFLDYTQTKDYEINSDNAYTLKALDVVEKWIGGDIPDEVGDYACAREELGFINGFRYAMQLAAACGLDVNVKVGGVA